MQLDKGAFKEYDVLITFVLKSPAYDSSEKPGRSTKKFSFVLSRTDALFTKGKC